MNYFTVKINTAAGVQNVDWNKFKLSYPRCAKVVERAYRKFDRRSVSFNNKRVQVTLV